MEVRGTWLKFLFLAPFFREYIAGLPRYAVSDILCSYLRNEYVAFYLKAYSFYPMYKDGGGCTAYHGIYADAEYGFVLRRNGYALASVWFTPNVEKKTVSIMQIQGIIGKKQDLANFRWERMLIQYMVRWARQRGFQEIRVVRSEKQKYFGKGGEESKRRFHMIYDISAKREGFSQEEGYHVFRFEKQGGVWNGRKNTLR